MRQWLIDARKHMGYSQTEVAKAVGITQASYCMYETGLTSPKPDNAKKIARVLGFPWTKFYE